MRRTKPQMWIWKSRLEHGEILEFQTENDDVISASLDPDTETYEIERNGIPIKETHSYVMFERKLIALL